MSMPDRRQRHAKKDAGCRSEQRTEIGMPALYYPNPASFIGALWRAHAGLLIDNRRQLPLTWRGPLDGSTARKTTATAPNGPMTLSRRKCWCRYERYEGFRASEMAAMSEEEKRVLIEELQRRMAKIRKTADD